MINVIVYLIVTYLIGAGVATNEWTEDNTFKDKFYLILLLLCSPFLIPFVLGIAISIFMTKNKDKIN